MKIRYFAKEILFLVIVFILFIGIVEVTLRTTHLFGARISWSEPDQVLGWRYTPGSYYWENKENDHPVTGKINNFGYRDNDWSIQKPDNVFRVAVMGDSYVEAMQVESDRTFLKLAERKLNQNNDLKVELMNFGRASFTQTEELIILKNDVIRFSPDMVILFFLPGNDIAEISKTSSGSLIRPYFHVADNGKLILDTSFIESTEFKVKVLINGIKQHSALISLLSERYNAYRKQYQLRKYQQKIQPQKIPWHLSLCTSNATPEYLENYRLNKILIKEMSEYCRDKGIRFMLVTIDTQAYIPKIETEYKTIDPSFNANFFEDDMNDYAEALNIDYLGLQRIFRKSFNRNGIPLHWGHWNYEGHKTVADALSGKLRPIIYPANN